MPKALRAVNVQYEVTTVAYGLSRGVPFTLPTPFLFQFARAKALGLSGDTVTYLGQTYAMGQEFQVVAGAVITADDRDVRLTVDFYIEEGSRDSEGTLLANSPIYTGPWAGRPLPATVPANVYMVITDYPKGSRSEWVNVGTYWMPVSGVLSLCSEGGTLAAPISTVAGAGLPYYDANPVKLPGGMAVRGKTILGCHIEVGQTGSAGGQSCNILIGNLGSIADNVAADLNYTDTGQTSFYDLSINFDSNGFRVHRNAPFNGVAGSSSGYVFASGANVDNDLWLGTGSYSLAAGQNRLLLQRRWTLFF